jgi:hypothetical protein
MFKCDDLVLSIEGSPQHSFADRLSQIWLIFTLTELECYFWSLMFVMQDLSSSYHRVEQTSGTSILVSLLLEPRNPSVSFNDNGAIISLDFFLKQNSHWTRITRLHQVFPESAQKKIKKFFLDASLCDISLVWWTTRYQTICTHQVSKCLQDHIIFISFERDTNLSVPETSLLQKAIDYPHPVDAGELVWYLSFRHFCLTHTGKWVNHRKWCFGNWQMWTWVERVSTISPVRLATPYAWSSLPN